MKTMDKSVAKRREGAEFLDGFRGAVRCSGMSRYLLSQRSGVPEASLSRFVRGMGGLSLASLDRLAEVLELRVVVRSDRSASAPEPVETE